VACSLLCSPPLPPSSLPPKGFFHSPNPQAVMKIWPPSGTEAGVFPLPDERRLRFLAFGKCVPLRLNRRGCLPPPLSGSGTVFNFRFPPPCVFDRGLIFFLRDLLGFAFFDPRRLFLSLPFGLEFVFASPGSRGTCRLYLFSVTPKREPGFYPSQDTRVSRPAGTCGGLHPSSFFCASCRVFIEAALRLMDCFFPFFVFFFFFFFFFFFLFSSFLPSLVGVFDFPVFRSRAWVPSLPLLLVHNFPTIP